MTIETETLAKELVVELGHLKRDIIAYLKTSTTQIEAGN